MGKNKISISFPFLQILTLVFITLKLAEIGPVAAWSWWAVLSPLWIPLVVVLLVVFAVYCFVSIR